MGGRGSSSGGGSRGGNTGGAEIKDRESLLSAGAAKQTEIDSVMEAVKRVYDTYGVKLDDIQIVTLGKGARSVLGLYDSNNNLAINKNFFYTNKMNAAYDNSGNYHPSRGNKSALEAVAAHEAGHALNAKLAGGYLDMGNVANDIVSQASKRLGISPARVKSGISGYAQQNAKETIAEAFCDVYCNGKKASKESRAIVDIMNKMNGGK